MSFFSDNTKVATTATPNFTVDSYKDPNVGQYGWTKSDTGHYNQLIQYVDECRKIYESIKSTAEAIPLVIEYYNKTKELYESVVIVNSDIDLKYSDFKSKYSDFQIKYEKFFSNYISFSNDFLDFTEKYEDVLVKEASAVASAAAAKASEDQTKLYRDEVKDLYDDLKDGQVYRGTWNPNSNAYPDPEGTNSVWDVVLNADQMSVVYDGKTWYNGDRLVYIEATKIYEQIATGLSGVQSINGKTGAVTLTYTDLGAAPDGFGLGSTQPSSVSDMNSDPNTWVGGGKIGWLRATSTTANRPDNQAGVLMITRYSGGTGAIYITFLGANRRTYTRRWTGSSWEDWVSIYDSGNKPGASDVGALASSGGTLSGNLIMGSGTDIYLRSSSSSNSMIYFQDGVDSNRSLGEIYNDRSTGAMVIRSYGATTSDQAWLRIRHDETSPMYRNAAGTYAVYHTGNKPTPADIGAVPSSGNPVINGNLEISGNLTVRGNEIEFANLNVGGELSERGHRVYSSGNKPTANELGVLSTSGGRLSGTDWGVTINTLDGTGSQIALEAAGKLPFTLWNTTTDNGMRFGWRRADGSFDTRFYVIDEEFGVNRNLSVGMNASVNGIFNANGDIKTTGQGNIYTANGGWVGCFPDSGVRGYALLEMPDELGVAEGWHSRIRTTTRNGWTTNGTIQDAAGSCWGYATQVYNPVHGLKTWKYRFDGSLLCPGNIESEGVTSTKNSGQFGSWNSAQIIAQSGDGGDAGFAFHIAGHIAAHMKLKPNGGVFLTRETQDVLCGFYAGSVHDNGARVFSPYNPPTLRDVQVDIESELVSKFKTGTTLEELVLQLMQEVADLKAQLNK